MTNRTWTRVEIREKMKVDNQWLIRGMVAIHARQTAEEQAHGHTTEDNGVGFNGVDSEILTSFVVQFKYSGRLSPKQIEIARKKMLKYAGQLAKIANGQA